MSPGELTGALRWLPFKFYWRSLQPQAPSEPPAPPGLRPPEQAILLQLRRERQPQPCYICRTAKSYWVRCEEHPRPPYCGDFPGLRLGTLHLSPHASVVWRSEDLNGVGNGVRALEGE